ncbi:MAG: hypothetical protein V1859_09270 [archaeon]
MISNSYSIDTSCGDNFCDSYETFYNCANDCPSGSLDNYCDAASDGICDSDCNNEDIDCTEYSSSYKKIEINYWSYAVTPITIIAAAAVFFILFKKIKSEKVEHDNNIYSVESINKFSNINQAQKREENKEDWGNKTEGQIISDIKQNENYKEYFQK